MAVRGEDLVVRAEVALDRPRLGGRFHDHEVLGHGGAECSTGPSSPRQSRAAEARRRRQMSRTRWRKSSSMLEVDLEVVEVARARRRRRAADSRPGGARRLARLDRRRQRRPRRTRAGMSPASAMCRASSRGRDLEEPDHVVREEERRRATASMNTGRLPSIIRRLVHTRPTSDGVGRSNRSTSSGCSFVGVDARRFGSRADASRAGARRVTRPMVPPAMAGRAMRQGGVEVDHQPDAAAGHPDPDADLAEAPSS